MLADDQEEYQNFSRFHPSPNKFDFTLKTELTGHLCLKERIKTFQDTEYLYILQTKIT